jgi:hypothetical protein
MKRGLDLLIIMSVLVMVLAFVGCNNPESLTGDVISKNHVPQYSKPLAKCLNKNVLVQYTLVSGEKKLIKTYCNKKGKTCKGGKCVSPISKTSPIKIKASQQTPRTQDHQPEACGTKHVQFLSQCGTTNGYKSALITCHDEHRRNTKRTEQCHSKSYLRNYAERICSGRCKDGRRQTTSSPQSSGDHQPEACGTKHVQFLSQCGTTNGYKSALITCHDEHRRNTKRTEQCHSKSYLRNYAERICSGRCKDGRRQTTSSPQSSGDHQPQVEKCGIGDVQLIDQCGTTSGYKSAHITCKDGHRRNTKRTGQCYDAQKFKEYAYKICKGRCKK